MIPEAILLLLTEWAIRAIALAAIAGALLWILRVKDASVRLAAWTAVLVGALLIPPAGFVGPVVTFSVPHPLAGPVAAAARNSAAVDTANPESAELFPGGQTPPATTSRPSVRWPAVLVSLWAVVAAAMLLRLSMGLWLSYWLRRGSRRIEEGVAESSGVAVPVTVGVMRPMILLPFDWREWEPWKLRAVIAHEKAHVDRRDPLCQAVAAFYRGVCWFHPLSWWLHRHLVELAEAASDDAALREAPDRLLYAEALLSFFERTQNRSRSEGVAMAKKGKATRRIERILDTGRMLSRSLAPRALAMLVLSAVPLIYLASSMRPVWAVAAQDVNQKTPGGSSRSAPPEPWIVAAWQKPARPDASASKKDFTGTWRIDPAQTTQEVSENPNAPAGLGPPPPPPPPPLPGQYEIEQITRSGDTLRIASGPAGTIRVTTIKLDGSEVQSPASNGVIRTARSRIDDGKIVTEWKLERRGKLILSGEEVRSLSQDGARQIVDKTVNSRQVIKTHIVMMREQ